MREPAEPGLASSGGVNNYLPHDRRPHSPTARRARLHPGPFRGRGRAAHAAADRRRLRLPPGLRGAQARAPAAAGGLPGGAAERGARDPGGGRHGAGHRRGGPGRAHAPRPGYTAEGPRQPPRAAGAGPGGRGFADRRRCRRRAPRAARPRAVRKQARLPAAGEGRLDARRRHLRRRSGGGAARQRCAQRPGGGGAHRRRDHHQAPGAHAFAAAAAAAQSGLRTHRGAAGLGLRHRGPVLRAGAHGMSALPSIVPPSIGALPDIDAMLSARTVWRAGRAPAVAADGESTGHAVLDALLPQGGWPRAALTELLLPADGVGELSLLLPTLARLTQAGGIVALVAPPYLPYAPAWQAAGVDLRHLEIIQADELG